MLNSETKANRNHKDSVFTKLFSEKNNLLELYRVKVYNINKGHNLEMAHRSSVLSGYEEFIAEIKENLKSMDIREAISQAIKSCISKNILVYFLERNGSEVVNMLLSEWNMDEAIAVAKEEAREETAKNMLAKGFSVADVLKATDLPSEQIMALR